MPARDWRTGEFLFLKSTRTKEMVMNAVRKIFWIFLVLPLTWTGCSEGNLSNSKASAPPGKNASPASVAKMGEQPKPGETAKPAEEAAEGDEIKANLAKLSPEDRKLAEAQKVCVESNEALGGMGVPIKIMVKDQPVFLCCNACKKGALADPEKTLAKLEKIKSEAPKSNK
jgi:hypothetical protein